MTIARSQKNNNPNTVDETSNQKPSAGDAFCHHYSQQAVLLAADSPRKINDQKDQSCWERPWHRQNNPEILAPERFQFFQYF